MWRDDLTNIFTDPVLLRPIFWVLCRVAPVFPVAVAHTIDALLRRFGVLGAALSAAVVGGMDAVRGYAWAALRFRPRSPVLERQCGRATALGADRRAIIAGFVVLIAACRGYLTRSPSLTRGGCSVGDRPAGTCTSATPCTPASAFRSTKVQVAELVAALLRHLRRARGRAGRLVYDRRFPDRLVAAFDPGGAR